MLAVNLDHAVTDAPRRAAAALELRAQRFELRGRQREARDDADALAAAALCLPADAHHRGADPGGPGADAVSRRAAATRADPVRRLGHEREEQPRQLRNTAASMMGGRIEQHRGTRIGVAWQRLARAAGWRENVGHRCRIAAARRPAVLLFAAVGVVLHELPY